MSTHLLDIDRVPGDGSVLSAVQGIDTSHVLRADHEVEHVRIRDDALRLVRLGQRRKSAILEISRPYYPEAA